MNLTIYRGDARIAQVTLTGKTMKLGRGKDNDVVLEDPGKGVSRVHAELRPEGNRYRLVDLQSQNGIWVSGERVPSVLLAPGVVAVMGPFRVAIDAASPLTQPFTPIKDVDTATEYSSRVPPPPVAPGPQPVPVEGAGSLLDDLGATAPPPVPPPDSRRPVPAPAKKPPVTTAVKTPSSGSGGSRAVMMAVAAVIVLAAGFGAYKFLLNKPAPKPVWDLAAATSLADAGRCQEAMDQQINRALAADPNNAEALALKAKCTAPPPPPPTTTVPPVVVTKSNAEKLDEAEASLQAKACQAALDTANEVLAADANDERAKGLLKKASDCLKPAATPGTAVATDALVKIAPAQGGLEPVPGETNRDYRARVAAARKRYDDAIALLQAQRYQAAVKELDAIVNQVPPGYLDLAQRRVEARNAMREEGNKQYQQAQQAEQRSEWNVAIERYQRAHDMDPAHDVTGDIRRVTETKTRIGRQLCSEGRTAYLLGNPGEAVDKLTRSLDLLPTTDECYAKAKDALSKIRR